MLSELGARTERVTEPGLGTHLVARVRPEQPRGKVLLAAHLDTVFGPGFAEKHPFHIEGEWAHGLGAGDCKSGVLISLFGALILKKAGLLPPWELTYLFTCDEETGSRSGRKVYAREAQDAALAPGVRGRPGAGRTSPVCHIPPGGDSGNRRRGGAGRPMRARRIWRAAAPCWSWLTRSSGYTASTTMRRASTTMWRPSPADGPTAWWPERPGGVLRGRDSGKRGLPGDPGQAGQAWRTR